MPLSAHQLADPITEIRLTYFELTGEHLVGYAESRARNMMAFTDSVVHIALAVAKEVLDRTDFNLHDGLQAHDRALQRMGVTK